MLRESMQDEVSSQTKYTDGDPLIPGVEIMLSGIKTLQQKKSLNHPALR
jgi:hypothetical protein